MKRIALSRSLTLLSLLILLFAAGLYGIFNKESLLAGLITPRLAGTGLSDIRLQQLAVSNNSLTLESISFVYKAPHTSGLSATITMSHIQGNLRWSQLLSHPIKSLTIGNLNVEVIGTPFQNPDIPPIETTTETQPLTLTQFIPATLAEQLPVDVLIIDAWKVHWKDKQAAGTFHSRNAETGLTASLALADTNLDIILNSTDKIPLTLTADWVNQNNKQASLTAKLIGPTTNTVQQASPDLLLQIDTNVTLKPILDLLADKQSWLQTYIKPFTSLTQKINTGLDTLQSDQLIVSGELSLHGSFAQTDAFVPPLALQQFFASNNAKSNMPQAGEILGDITLNSQLSITQKDQNIEAVSQATSHITLTKNSWQLIAASPTDPSTNQAAKDKDYLAISGNTPWLSKSSLLGTFLKNAKQQYLEDLQGAFKFSSQSATIKGSGLTPTKITLQNTRLAFSDSKKIPVNLQLKSPNSVINTPFAKLNAQSDIQLSISAGPKKNTLHHWQGVIKRQQLSTTETETTLKANSPELAIDLSANLHSTTHLTSQEQSINYQVNSNNIATSYALLKQSLPSAFKLPPSLRSLDFSQGQVTMQGTYSKTSDRKNNVTQHHNVNWQGQNIVGLYDDLVFEELSTTGSIEGLPGYTAIKSSAPIAVSIKTLRVGTNIEDINWIGQIYTSQPNFDSLVVQTTEFNARMFKGDLALIEPFDYSLAGGNAVATLKAKAWQLGELVALQKQPIQAQGILDGNLDLILSKEGLAIPEGTLFARPPGGTIRYPLSQTQSIIASSPELDLAMRMLDNFNYKALSSTISLTTRGELHIGLNLNGRNPAEYNGRNVEFNINVDQNVLPLLESLRLSDQVIKHIEKKIKQRF